MFPWWGFAALVLLLVTLVWLVRRRAEAFVGSDQPADPKEIIQKVRGLLERYNDPALWAHLETVVGKDLGDLARQTANKQ